MLGKLSKAELKYVLPHQADLSLSQEISANLLSFLKTLPTNPFQTRLFLDYPFDLSNILRVIIFMDGDAQAAQITLLEMLLHISKFDPQTLRPSFENTSLRIDNYGRPLINFDFLRYFNKIKMLKSSASKLPENIADLNRMTQKPSLSKYANDCAFFLAEHLRSALSYIFVSYSKLSLIGGSLVIQLPQDSSDFSSFLGFLVESIQKVQLYYFQPIQHLWLVVNPNQPTSTPTDTISKLLLKYKRAKFTFNAITSTYLNSNSRPLSSIAYMASVNLPQISKNHKAHNLTLQPTPQSSFPIPITSHPQLSTSNPPQNPAHFSDPLSNTISAKNTILFGNANSSNSRTATRNRFGSPQCSPHQSNIVLISELSFTGSSNPVILNNTHLEPRNFHRHHAISSVLDTVNSGRNASSPAFRVKPSGSRSIFSTLSAPQTQNSLQKSSHRKKKTKSELEFEELVRKSRVEQVPWGISMPMLKPHRSGGIVNVRLIASFISRRMRSLGSVIHISFAFLGSILAQIPSKILSVYNLTRYCTMVTIELSDRLISYVSKFPIMKLVLLIRNKDSQTVSLFLSWICACFIMDVHFTTALKSIASEFLKNKRMLA